jgi:hypothetical protein
MKHLPHYRPLFGGALQSMITSRDQGIVHPEHPDFTQSIEALLEMSRAEFILAQSLAMRTDVADVCAGAELESSAAMPKFLRTKNKADAVLYPAGGIDTGVLRGKVAALMMVADSPGITVFDPDRDIVGFANGSMECLDPPDGSNGIVAKMIEQMKAAGSDPKHIMMVVSACARACCFGYDMSTAQNAPRTSRDWSCDPSRSGWRGPRRQNHGTAERLLPPRPVLPLLWHGRYDPLATGTPCSGGRGAGAFPNG